MANTPTKPIRISPELWAEAGAAAARSQPPTDRSALIREFFSWYVRRPGAKIPKRPAAEPSPEPDDNTATSHEATSSSAGDGN